MSRISAGLEDKDRALSSMRDNRLTFGSSQITLDNEGIRPLTWRDTSHLCAHLKQTYSVLNGWRISTRKGMFHSTIGTVAID